MSVRAAKLSSQFEKGFAMAICFTLLLVVGGCGAPGEPTAPSPLVPAQITNLTARQAGDGVQLTFTMPGKTVAGDRLIASPAVEILRGTAKPDGSPDLKSLRVVDTIPGSLTNKYLVADKLQFIDPLAPEEIKARPGSMVLYAVRTRASEKRTSADSNMASVRVFPVPERIAALAANATESAIELSWPAVDRTSAGEPLNISPRYNIYRAEWDDAASAEAATRETAQANWSSKLILLASQPENTYSDKAFEFGKAYVYIVRSLITIEATALESADSVPTIVTPRDIFPPAPPRDLAAAVLPGETAGSLLIDLSWSISVETDFAGYRVYRSEQAGTRGQLLTAELLLTPTVRDTSVQPAHRYWYTVTAVDRDGNESSPSTPLAVDVAQPSP